MLLCLKSSTNTSALSMCRVLTPAGSAEGQASSHSFPPHWDGGENGQSEKTPGLTQRQFNRERQSNPHKQSKTRNSIPPSQGQAGAQPSPGRPGSIPRNRDLGRQRPPPKTSPCSCSFPQFYRLSMRPCALGHPLAWLGSAVPAVPSPSPSLVRWGERQKMPWLCVSSAQQ